MTELSPTAQANFTARYPTDFSNSTASESWLTAAIPVDNPYCSCKLTYSCNPHG